MQWLLWMELALGKDELPWARLLLRGIAAAKNENSVFNSLVNLIVATLYCPNNQPDEICFIILLLC
jgi:hypothetical protein